MDFAGGEVVFCKIDEVLSFFERLRLTRRRVVLVTGQGDFPCDPFRQNFEKFNSVGLGLEESSSHWPSGSA
jgi:hypothetical protein